MVNTQHSVSAAEVIQNYIAETGCYDRWQIVCGRRAVTVSPPLPPHISPVFFCCHLECPQQDKAVLSANFRDELAQLAISLYIP